MAKLYTVRCWDPVTSVPTTQSFSLHEILTEPDVHHMNMADVGLVLLNLRRVEIGMKPIPPEQVAGYETKVLG